MDGLNLIWKADYHADVLMNSVPVGEFYKEVDGYFVFYPELKNGGFWSQDRLRLLAEKLEELNKDWDAKVQEFCGGKV